MAKVDFGGNVSLSLVNEVMCKFRAASLPSTRSNASLRLAAGCWQIQQGINLIGLGIDRRQMR